MIAIIKIIGTIVSIAFMVWYMYSEYVDIMNDE